jgi:hypothetical protein
MDGRRRCRNRSALLIARGLSRLVRTSIHKHNRRQCQGGAGRTDLIAKVILHARRLRHPRFWIVSISAAHAAHHRHVTDILRRRRRACDGGALLSRGLSSLIRAAAER